jgi:hypothetical protein
MTKAIFGFMTEEGIMQLEFNGDNPELLLNI